MDETVYHVVPHERGWAVKKAGSEQNSRVLRTQVEARSAARSFAENQAPGRVVVHRRDGRISEQLRIDEPSEPPAAARRPGPDEADEGWSLVPTPRGWAVLGLLALLAGGLGYWWARRSEASD
jgi:hypothetical protein